MIQILAALIAGIGIGLWCRKFVFLTKTKEWKYGYLSDCSRNIIDEIRDCPWEKELSDKKGPKTYCKGDWNLMTSDEFQTAFRG